MRMLGNWLLAQRVVTTILYNLLRLVFLLVQRIYWQFNGTAQKLREARLLENYEQSAQVLDVVFSHKFCAQQQITIDNFLCTHNRFENPQYIIDNDNITLMTLTEQDAVFCEPAEKDMHLWRVQYGSFMRVNQVVFCRRLIVVPLSTLHRLADKIGDPQGELTFLFNTARCGSTLMTQIMEYTGRCVAVSEPNTPNIIAMKYRKFGKSPELCQLARDVMRWEFRPYPTIQPPPLGYFVKIAAPSVVGLPLFRELYPSSKCLFLYRDVVAVSKSLYRISVSLPSLRLGYITGQLSGLLTKLMADAMGYDGSDYRIRLDNDLTLGIVLCAVSTVAYLDMRRRGADVTGIRYEDLVAKRSEMCRAILEMCNFPVSLAEDAVKGFDVDSQRNSIIARSIVRHYKEPELTPEIKVRLNELLKKYGMPLIGEPDILEGTLSC